MVNNTTLDKQLRAARAGKKIVITTYIIIVARLLLRILANALGNSYKNSLGFQCNEPNGFLIGLTDFLYIPIIIAAISGIVLGIVSKKGKIIFFSFLALFVLAFLAYGLENLVMTGNLCSGPNF